MPLTAYDVDVVEGRRAEYKNPARAAAGGGDLREFGPFCDLIVVEIEQVKSELARTKRKLRRAYSEAIIEHRTLIGLLTAQTNSHPVYEKRSETALAKVVLAAQLKSKRKSPRETWLRRLRNRSKARHVHATPTQRSNLYVISANGRSIAS
jgi:hypothetical protein